MIRGIDDGVLTIAMDWQLIQPSHLRARHSLTPQTLDVAEVQTDR